MNFMEIARTRQSCRGYDEARPVEPEKIASMLEAARIDGASEFRIYWQIVMPNVKPAWMTLIIFSFQAMWNNTGASYLYSEELKMLPSIIGTITAGGVRRTGVSAAAALLMMLPPILIFVFSQNNVIETMSSSGLKE